MQLYIKVFETNFTRSISIDSSVDEDAKEGPALSCLTFSRLRSEAWSHHEWAVSHLTVYSASISILSNVYPVRPLKNVSLLCEIPVLFLSPPLNSGIFLIIYVQNMLTFNSSFMPSWCDQASERRRPSLAKEGTKCTFKVRVNYKYEISPIVELRTEMKTDLLPSPEYPILRSPPIIGASPIRFRDCTNISYFWKIGTSYTINSLLLGFVTELVCICSPLLRRR